MENPLPGPKAAGKRGVVPVKAPSLANDTKMARDTTTPDENDPAWKELGRTHVVKRTDTDDAIPVPKKRSDTRIANLAGKQFGDFQIKEKLGEGAMGEVYLAEQISFNNRPVALKILFTHVASNPKLVERFKRESRVMAELDHPNIIQAHGYDFNETEGRWYVAMELVTGQSTQKWLTQLGKMPVADAVQIMLACAQAIGYAHKQNVIHRDIKPDNIMLTSDGIVKVADLGMVKTSDEDMSLTQTGHAVGTPWYMPLEQARNAKEIDGRSDIYALGCTLYAFLTGMPPFVGKTLVDVIKAKEAGTFPPARRANSAIPEQLDLILAKMTAKRPEHRYQNCADLIKDLENLGLAGKPISFLNTRAIAQEQEQETIGKMKATVETALDRARSDTPFEILTIDPNVWYLQVKTPAGSRAARKYTTAQLQKMLNDGVIKPNAKISHSEIDGFRAVGTFKEFQGQVLGKTTKKGADKQTARSRSLIKKIVDEDRDKEKKERADNKIQSQAQATLRYWLGLVVMGLPIGLGIITFVCALYWLGTEGASVIVPTVPGVLFFCSLIYAFFARR